VSLNLIVLLIIPGTHEDERTVLYKTKSLDGTKPNTNPKTKTKTNRNPNTNLNHNKLTQILTVFSGFMLFIEHRPLIFSLAIIPNTLVALL